MQDAQHTLTSFTAFPYLCSIIRLVIHRALVSLDFHLGHAKVGDQLMAIHKSLNDIKNSPLAAVQLWIQNRILSFVPFSLTRRLVYGGFWRHSINYSIVPGPPKPCLLAGQQASEVQMMFSHLNPQVSFVSYNDSVWGNITIDPNAMPNSEMIPFAFSMAFVLMAEAFGIECPDQLAAHAKEIDSCEIGDEGKEESDGEHAHKTKRE